jgi:hypothetical protein
MIAQRRQFVWHLSLRIFLSKFKKFNINLHTGIIAPKGELYSVQIDHMN